MVPFPPLINRISENEAKESVGSFAALDWLLEHLGLEIESDGDGKVFCLAASVITRSEAEIFGISFPRFAVRAYVKGGGFVQCRRVEALIEAAKAHELLAWSQRNSELDPEARYGDDEVTECADGTKPFGAEIRERSRSVCVADAMVPPRPRYTGRNYHYLQSDLFAAYGEPPSAGVAHSFTPFVRTIDLTGGVCAQSVCFMATALLARYATRICGLAEITTLANADRCRELPVNGLRAAQMQRYFLRVNLRMSEQAVKFNPPRTLRGIRKGEPEDRARVPQVLASAIRAYLRAGMPIILPTNVRHLALNPTMDTSVYYQNGIGLTELGKEELKRDINVAHAVLIVGWRDPYTPPGQKVRHEFYFHDPASVPCLMIEIAQLLAAGAPEEAGSKIIDAGLICPVTPRSVRLPLLDERRETQRSDGRSSYLNAGGLLSIRRRLRILLRESAEEISRARDETTQRLLRLARLAELDDAEDAEPFHLVLGARATDVVVGAPSLGAALASRLADAIRSLELERQWLWLEVHKGSIWLWDATASAWSARDRDSFVNMVARYLFAVVDLTREDELVIHCRPAP